MEIRKIFIGLFTCILAVSIFAGCMMKNKVERQQQTGPVELTMWIQELFSPEGQFIENRIRVFNEVYNGKIHVNLIGIPRPTYEAQIDAAVNTGQLPDMIAVDAPYVAKYAEVGAIIPMDDYADKDFLSDFLPTIINQGTYKDKLYQLASKDTSVAIYYNRQMLKNAGIPVPTNIEEAWTWDQLLQNAKKLTKHTVYGLDMYTNYRDTEWFTYAFLPFVWSNGGDIVAPDGVTVEGYLNGPKSVEAFDFIGKLFKEGVVDTSLVDSSFQNQKVAMMFGGSWLSAELKSNYPNLQWGIMPYPVSPNTKKQVTPHGSYGYSITSNAKNPQAAFEFIKWMLSPESMIQEHEATGVIPGRKSVLNEIPEYQVLPEKIMIDQLLTTARSRPKTPIYPVIAENFGEAFKAVALGEDTQKALDDAVKNIEAVR